MIASKRAMQPEPKSGVSVPLAKSEEEHERDACATPERATRAAELLKSALDFVFIGPTWR